MTSKLKTQRPGSSARVYEDENSEYDAADRKSKIPRLPKRTYSLEGKENFYFNCKRLGNKYHNGTISMIPRPEWNKYFKKCSIPETHSLKGQKIIPQESEQVKSFRENEKSETVSEDPKLQKKKVTKQPLTAVKNSSCESRINEGFAAFKNNVLRIPEYWSDAGQTVTNILKNAVNIVSKQYPNANVEAFENEIQNIIKATEEVKQQIMSKTDNIITQANTVYLNKSELGAPNEDELRQITKKMESLRNEVKIRKNVFGDLLKCSNEVKHLVDLEKAITAKGETQKELSKENEAGKNMKKTKKSEKKPKEKNTMHSCGDFKEPNSNSHESFGENASTETYTYEEKSTQTINLLTAELHKREEDLSNLNDQIKELHQMCNEHISKFKNFNLQIKLKGICNKVQNLSASREIQILNDEKLQLAEKNNELLYYNKDLESAIKQRDLDIHQKDKLIHQQKKLLQVRDELIEMLKSRVHIEEVKQI